MTDLARIKRNVAKMAAQGAPEADIDGYIASEGVTVQQVRDFKETAVDAPRTGATSSLDYYARNGVPGFGAQAFATKAIDAIPIVGPSIRGGLEDFRAGISSLFGGPSKEEMRSSDELAMKGAPIATAAGEVFGTAAPFVAGGAIPGVSRLLGMSGGLPSQIGFGAASGSAISAGDAAVRGGNANDIMGAAALGLGAGALAPAAGRVIGSLFGGSVPREAKNLARALKDDQIPVGAIDQRLGAMGDDAMLMDLGPNLQRQAGALASIPGEAQKMVRKSVFDRAKAAGGRVQNDVAQTIGTGPDIDSMKQQIVAAQSAAASPLYDAVRDVALPMTGGNYQFVFSTPMGKEALKEALRMAANDGKQYSELTVGLVDYAKRALDDVAASAARAGNNNRARQASNLANVLRTETDKLVPEYKAARDAFAGPAAVLDAIDLGQTLFSKEMSPMQLHAMVVKMTPSERDALLQSGRAAVEAMMGNAVNDVVSLRNLLRRGWNEQKLRILLGNDVANDLLRRVDRELAFGTTANIVSGNSETAARQLAQQEVAPELRNTRTDSIIGWIARAFDAARGAIQGRVQPKANARLAAALQSGVGQIDPLLLKQAQMAATATGNGAVAPAIPGLLATRKREPIEITVGTRTRP